LGKQEVRPPADSHLLPRFLYLSTWLLSKRKRVYFIAGVFLL